MKVDRKEILHIANLADIELKEEEIEKYINNLEDILSYIDAINNAPLDGIDVTTSSLENYNVFRKDEIIEFEDKQSLLSNAPDEENNMFKIPKVIGE